MAKIARHSGLGVSIAITPLRCSRLARELDHLRQPLRRHVLHHLRTEDAVERRLRQILQILEQIRLLGVQALVPADRDRFVAEVDAARRDARSRIISRNSPRPQPRSSTFVLAREVRPVELPAPALTYSSVPRKRSAKRP